MKDKYKYFQTTSTRSILILIQANDKTEKGKLLVNNPDEHRLKKAE